MNKASGSSVKKRIFQIVLAVPMAVFLLIGIRGMISDYTHIKTQERLLAARTSTADGIIVEIYEAARGTIKFKKEVIAFRTDAGREITFKALANKGDKIGMTMTVNYDPANPDNFAVGKEIFSYSDLFRGNIFFLLMGIFFLFLICWIGRTPNDEL
ncbi:MAG TPA: DUF3592 domain-containing protein [Smithella sp.]|nr:DUF3592 domain-containing protein [Smithella sp.]